MNYESYNELSFKEKLTIIHQTAIEIDNIFPWFGNLRIIRIYKLYDFFIELEFDLTIKENTYVNAFKSFDYLEKYPQYFEKIIHETTAILKR